ncbi:hypothetical protein Tco_0223259 [Tanacetum coccineum]
MALHMLRDLWASRAARFRQRDAIPSPVLETEMPLVLLGKLDLPQLWDTFIGFADMIGCPAPDTERLKELGIWFYGYLGMSLVGAIRAQSRDACDQDTFRGISLRTTVRLIMSEITELQAAEQTELEPTRRRPIAVLRWLMTVAICTKMAPRGRPTRLNPGTTPPPVTDTHTTTSVTSAQLQAMIDEGVTAVLAARATTRNGDDSHTSGTGVRRNERAVREISPVKRALSSRITMQALDDGCGLGEELWDISS